MMSVPQDAYSNTDQGAVPAGYPSTDLDNRNTPVSILVFTEFADTTTAAPVNEFRNTITAIENTYGPEFHYDNLTSYTQLSSMIPNYDILLIMEQERMNQSDLIDIASAWTTPLTTFVNGGGILIVTDCDDVFPADIGNGPTMRILNETGLMTVFTPFASVGWTNNLVNTSDALARGVSASWSAPDGSVRFMTPDATVVVDDGASAIVAHKIIGAGHVVLLGFDFFTTESNSSILLANAIRLHRHVVFDASHNTLYRITSGFSLFAEDLADNGFAVSGMDTFDVDILQAAEVLVISIGDYHFDSYTSQEVDAIEEFVSSGGGLFIISDFVQYGNVTDPVNERFGFVRNKTSILYDSDDFNAASSGYAVIYSGTENINSHSATLNVNSLETWSGTGLESYPTGAVPLVVGDSDGTTTYDSFIPTNGVVFSAAATYDSGRVIFVGETGMFIDTDLDSDGTEAYFDTNSDEFARNCIGWLSAAGIEEKTVLFEESHNPNVSIDGSITDFATLLTENGYTLNWMTEFQPSLISSADLLFINDGATAYNASEIATITSFVANGGGLYLAGSWGPYIEEVQTIGNEFGFGSGSYEVLIDTDDTVGPNDYIVYDGANIVNHPITQGITRLELYRSGTIEVPNSAIVPIVRTDPDGTSDYILGTPADDLPVMAATQSGSGRIFYSCNYVALRGNNDGDGDGVNNLYEADNSLLYLNAFHWLLQHNEPTVTLTFPNGGQVLNGTQMITWNSTDADGDSLTFEVLYSDNNGADWTSLATSITVNQFAWNTTALDDGTQYLIRVIASDSESSVFDESDSVFELDNFAGGLPFGIDTNTLLLIAAIIVIVIILGYLCSRRRGGGKPSKKSGSKKKKK